MIDEKNIKEKINGFENEFKVGIGKISKRLEEVGHEMKIISVPKSKKDILINGRQGYISLLSDGRVIIHCSTLDDGQKVYDSFKEIKKTKEKSWWRKYLSF